MDDPSFFRSNKNALDAVFRIFPRITLNINNLHRRKKCEKTQM